MTWSSRGVDVSSHQPPKAVPWKALRASGVDFAILRACMGLGRDEAMLEHARRARGEGVDVLALYGVLYPRRELRAQADLLGEAMAAIGGVAPVLDLEVMNDREPAEVADMTLAYVERVEAGAGLACVAYTYPSFAEVLPLSPLLASRPLWIAHYRKLTSGPRVPKPWSDWLIWQHDGDGGEVAPGGMDLDFNVCRLSLPALRALLVPAGSSPVDTSLGALAGNLRAAEGRGASVEEFVSRDEGPVIR